MTTQPTQPSPGDVHDAEENTTPYVHQLPDGTEISIPHEVTLSAIGKDRANTASLERGPRALAVALMELALTRDEFARLEQLTDRQFFALFNAWMDHCGLSLGESGASTS